MSTIGKGLEISFVKQMCLHKPSFVRGSDLPADCHLLIIPLSKDNISLYKWNMSSTELFIWQGQKMHKTPHIYKLLPMVDIVRVFLKIGQFSERKKRMQWLGYLERC